VYYGRRLASAKQLVARDDVGWLGLTSDGVVQFHTNAPLNGQRVVFALPPDAISNVDPNPRVLFARQKSIRVTLNGKDRILVFSGLKTGYTKADKWLSRVPHVGQLADAVVFTAREAPGAGRRATDAAAFWAAALCGGLDTRRLEVIGHWPSHPADVQPSASRVNVHTLA
jgi:hypothetical protein